MDYENTQIKLDSLIGYFNEGKMNLSPIFQRGRAWTLPMRQELIKNIVRHRPIPAIFLYKEESDARYSYNILDGKQRLETIVLFIADKNPKLRISNWKQYIFDRQYREQAGFPVKFGEMPAKIPFQKFSDDAVRDLREYQLALIEIKLGEETNLDEVINLFVDINQRGAKVTRLQIIRAVKRDDPFLNSIYSLVAEKQRRYHDTFVLVKKGTVSKVLEKLSAVAGAADKHAKADRMWGKLLELALFIRNGNSHGKGSDVLKKFAEKKPEAPLTAEEKKRLRRVFTFLDEAYKHGLGGTRLATDYSHFYIMVTSLLSSDLLAKDAIETERRDLMDRLMRFSKFLESQPVLPGDARMRTAMHEYLSLSARQTTDAKKRKRRQDLFEELIRAL